jgi:F-type H+-transporting ATPase subunit alpha
VTRFEEGLMSDIRSNHADILADIREKLELTGETSEKLKAACEAYAKSFIDS